MSYLGKMVAEEPLKNSQKVNKLQIPNSSYLKSFKKTMGNNNTSKPKTQMSQRCHGNQQNIKPYKIRQKSPIADKNKNHQFQQLQFMMQETDNSMEQLLNSSINQFQKLIIHEESGESLQQQNYRLKNALSKMKNILKDKLQNALQKQKQQLSKMLQDYISLITKLLQDKQELTIKIQDLVDENQRKLKQMEKQFSLNLKQRDEKIYSAKNQIQQFLTIIQQYEQQTRQEQTKFMEMQQRIQQLEQERQQYAGNRSQMEHQISRQQHERTQSQSQKIQTLLDLLQKTQQENSDLKSQIGMLRTRQNSNNSTMDLREIKLAYERKIQEIQHEHEEEFLQYEKAIRDTLSKKDQCIERLNIIIEGYRERKNAH